MEITVTKEGNVSVYRLSDLEAVSHRAASIFRVISKDCIASHGRFVLAISGGSTPRRFYALLGSNHYCRDIDWDKVHLFWVDERCVPKEDEASNFKAAFDNRLSKVPIPYNNIHRIRGEDGPERGAIGYEEDIRNFFGISGLPVFDLVILGVGEDGHTASLFPGSGSLREKERLVVPVHMKEAKPDRITLTLPLLNNAAHILFLVSGASKMRIAGNILGDKKKGKQYPAGLINPVHGDITWLIGGN